ncbi:MAG TPA: alpha/beta fold hydrolase [Gemmatimonadales bacterium]|nr:alpha/beta fold hydrolase [Gemmatimonadales bacterium]
MATPTITRHALPGALGPIDVDVRAGGRDTPRPAVVILHGFKGFKDWGMFVPLAERLAKAGFSAVSLNVSGSGVDEAGDFSRPEAFGHNTYSAELDDLGRVLDGLAAGELGVPAPTRTGLLGHSRGGGVSILRAASDARIAALVTWAAIGSVERWSAQELAAWRRAGRTDVVNSRTGQVLPLYTDVLDDVDANRERLDVRAAAARLPAPWLLLHGTADDVVPLSDAEALVAAQPRALLERVEGGGHTFGTRHPWAGSTPEFDRVLSSSVAWFGRHLT